MAEDKKKSKVTIKHPQKISFPVLEEKKLAQNFTMSLDNSAKVNGENFGKKWIKGVSTFMPVTAEAIMDEINGKKGWPVWKNFTFKAVNTLMGIPDSLGDTATSKIVGLSIGIVEEAINKGPTIKARQNEWKAFGEAWDDAVKNKNIQSFLGDGEHNLFSQMLQGVDRHLDDIDKFLKTFEEVAPLSDLDFKVTLPKKLKINADSIDKKIFAAKAHNTENTEDAKTLQFNDMIKQFWHTNDSFQNLFDVYFIEKDKNDEGLFLGERNLKDWLKSAKVLSSRVESISLPSIQGTTITHNFIGSTIEKRTNGMTDTHQGSFTIRGDDTLHLIRRFNQISQTNILDTQLSYNLKSKIKGFKEQFGDNIALEDWRIVEGEVPPTYFSQNKKTLDIHIYMNRANELAKRGDEADPDTFIESLTLAQTEVHMLKDHLWELSYHFKNLEKSLNKQIKDWEEAIANGEFSDNLKTALKNRKNENYEKSIDNIVATESTDKVSKQIEKEKREAEEAIKEETYRSGMAIFVKKEEDWSRELDILIKYYNMISGTEREELSRRLFGVQGANLDELQSFSYSKSFKDFSKKMEKLYNTEQKELNKANKAIEKGRENAIAATIETAQENLQSLIEKKQEINRLEKRRDALLSQIEEKNRELSQTYLPFHIEIKNVKILGTDNAISFKREGASTQSFSYNFIYRNYEVKPGNFTIRLNEE